MLTPAVPAQHRHVEKRVEFCGLRETCYICGERSQTAAFSIYLSVILLKRIVPLEPIVFLYSNLACSKMGIASRLPG